MATEPTLNSIEVLALLLEDIALALHGRARQLLKASREEKLLEHEARLARRTEIRPLRSPRPTTGGGDAA